MTRRCKLSPTMLQWLAAPRSHEELTAFIQSLHPGLLFWMFQRELLRELLPGLPDHQRRELQALDAAPAERIPDALGSCCVLFVCQDLTEPSGEARILRDAFLLPFVWREGEQDSPHLPPQLQQVAQVVRGQFASTDDGKGERWGLHPGASWEGCDLSGLVKWRCGSAWASLSAGLILARNRIVPRRDVFASAAWDEGLRQVRGIEAKAALVGDYGARYFFLAHQVQIDAPDSEPLPEIRSLKASESDPYWALLPLLQELSCPPERSAPYATRLSYANEILTVRSQRESYTVEYLIEDMVERASKPEANVDALQLIVSNRSGSLFSILSNRPRRCLLFYTGRDEDTNLPMLLEDLERLADFPCEIFTCKIAPQDYTFIGQVARLFFESSHGAALQLADVTGGLTGMKSALLLTTVELEGVGSYYVDSASLPSGRGHQIGTERLLQIVRPDQCADSGFFEISEEERIAELGELPCFRHALSIGGVVG